MTKCDFSLDHYRDMVEQALSLGYGIYPLYAYAQGAVRDSRTILLRHDVDVSLEKATSLAKVEAELGIGATYFVRLHARYYNVLSPESWQHLIGLREVATEIGLHYEPLFYRQQERNPMDMLAYDARVLSTIVDTPILGCAAHQPAQYGALDMAAVRSAGLAYEASAPEFVKERKYISDSRRYWREGCLCQWLGRVDHLTVLMHAVWWLGFHETRSQILERIAAGD